MKTFIARQPIFDVKQEVYAYELLFRSGMENFFNGDNLDQASSKVIGDSVLLHGLDVLTAGKKAFYNVTRQTLTEGYCAMLPEEQTVVEILENIEPDAETLEACKKLKEAGYPIALDDFVYEEKFKPFLELADIIKVDFLLSDKAEQRDMAERFIPKGIQMLAEKVETWEIYQEAKEMGYVFFQGYYFAKPTILSTKDIPSFKLHYLQILQEIQKPQLSYQGLEEIIKREMSLSYKLLRYINSAFFGWQVTVSSINHALVLLGEVEVKKWTSLMALSNMADGKTDELVIQAIVRAKFCESLAPKLGLAARSQDLFLMGMFSLIDGIMDRPIEEVLEKIPIESDIKDALLGKEGRLRDIYQLILSYEKGDWEAIPPLHEKLRLDEEGIAAFYLEAVDMANQSFKGAN
ncbi:Predicted signal transduction protein [hydrothermal vent metagenome]|uniref:Predicted signal transduction protein n=2 Tax=hydrothermal vent metagenome TaxID=652676 RepID=A0A3B1CNK9_9ZZZZ